MDWFYKDLTWVLPLRNEGVTAFFQLMPHLMSPLFFLTIIVVGYWCYHQRFFSSLFTFLCIGTLLTWFLKAYFGTSRPSIEHLVEANNTTSFPSGDVLVAFTIWGIIGLYINNRILRIFGGLVVVAIACSRIYLGVHYPIDVVGGFIIGGGLIGIFWLLEKKGILEKYDGSLLALFVSGIVLSLYFIFIKERVPIAAAGGLIGLMISRYLLGVLNIKDERNSKRRKLLLIIVGITGFFFIRRFFIIDNFSSYGSWLYFMKYVTQVI